MNNDRGIIDNRHVAAKIISEYSILYNYIRWKCFRHDFIGKYWQKILFQQIESTHLFFIREELSIHYLEIN